MKKKIFIKIFDLLILAIIPLIVIVIWFHNGFFYAGGEEGLPFYNIIHHLEIINYIWNDVGTGYPVLEFLPRVPFFYLLSLLTNFGVSTLFAQALTFYLTMVAGCVSVYYLVKISLGEVIKKFHFLPVIAAFFYLCNPFSMTQVWGRGLYFQIFAFSEIPLFLLFFILGITRKNIFYGIFAIFSTVIFAQIFMHPAYIITLWAPCLLYLFVYILTNRNNTKELFFSCFFFIFCFLGWLLLDAWWLFPYFKLAAETHAGSLNTSGSEENLDSLRGVSIDYPFFSLIRLIHRGYFYGAKYYGEIYANPLFICISWFIPFIIFLAFFYMRKLSQITFYLFFLLVALFISLGSNAPLGWLFELLFIHISPLQSLRNPFEKFGVVLMLSYTPFFTLGIYALRNGLEKLSHSRSKTNSMISIVLFLIFVVYLWPFWIGKAAGGVVINSWIAVPNYYKQADTWLTNQPGDFRLMQFPLNPGDGLRYAWPSYYQGTDPSEYIFTRMSIAKNVMTNKPYYNVLLDRFGILQKNVFGPDPDITHSAFTSNTFADELAKLNVRYIVLHNDYDSSLGSFETPQKAAAILKNEPHIPKVKTFGKLDIYKVDIPNNIHLIYSANQKISYKKINPTLYQVSVTNAKKPFTLNFLNSFATGWQATINGKIITKHNLLFSYANSWDIERKGNYTITIFYQPQLYAEKGRQISIITFWILAIFTMVSFLLLSILKKLKSNKNVP